MVAARLQMTDGGVLVGGVGCSWLHIKLAILSGQLTSLHPKPPSPLPSCGQPPSLTLTRVRPSPSPQPPHSHSHPPSGHAIPPTHSQPATLGACRPPPPHTASHTPSGHAIPPPLQPATHPQGMPSGTCCLLIRLTHTTRTGRRPRSHTWGGGGGGEVWVHTSGGGGGEV